MNNKCPKCGGEMEEGVIMTVPVGQKMKWGTWGQAMLGGHSLKNQKEIIVYRCKSCGFLESYAK